MLYWGLNPEKPGPYSGGFISPLSVPLSGSNGPGAPGRRGLGLNVRAAVGPETLRLDPYSPIFSDRPAEASASRNLGTATLLPRRKAGSDPAQVCSVDSSR